MAKPSDTIAIVEWEDPATYASWMSKNKAGKKKPGHVVSVGLWLGEHSGNLILALDEMDYGDKYNGVAVIPRKCVISVQWIKMPVEESEI